MKVQDGCSGRCTFCIVPQFRGEPRSIKLSDIVQRAKGFIKAGYKELVITGCNLALYRSEGAGLGKLLSTLASLDETVRIRLSSYEPCICDDGLLDAFINHKNICRFLHISLQSASNRILERMKRPYSIEQVAGFCEKVRSLFGGHFMLGCDIICGFPAESEEDFSMTRKFLERYDFCNVHAFPYSERPGTPAATMDGVIEKSVRDERVRSLMQDWSKRHDKFLKSFIGQEVEICIETQNDHSTGWTGEYVFAKVDGNIPRRSLAKGRVSHIEENTLIVETKED
jgi:threonylcarbamoyladenosine tRNA methylthiotransferase MtaB